MLWLAALPGAFGEEKPKLPAPAAHQVRFKKEIQPIIETSCLNCHGRGRAKGGFRLETRETLLKGGNSGDAVKSGDSAQSPLIHLVAGLDPDNIMPAKGRRLTAQQVALLRAWIDQGLPWDADVSFAKKEPQNLVCRAPALPQDLHGKNPIDYLLQAYWKSNKFNPPEVAPDRVFARRVYLDAIGLLPAAEELEAFVADTNAVKRAELARTLLQNNEAYAQHWLTFWNDLLRNDYRGTGYIDGGRKQITSWLYSALVTNMPYDTFVAALVNPSAESEGFIKGIVWRGVVNSSQTPQMQAAQNVSQVFMGVNLKCASCHDSFVNTWRLSDAYNLAAVFSDEPLEMFECDKPTGQTAHPAFLYPSLGNFDASTNRAARLQQLADLLTHREDGRLARTIVNRLWAQFMGRGLVEPLDDMEQPASHADILDYLAEDLVEHGYDLKRTMQVIFSSKAYQLPIVDLPEGKTENLIFRGPLLRRLSAEQFRDSIAQITGEWFAKSHYPGVTNRARASLVPSDPLMTAMGRPNREQVVTSRQTSATTLQALELTNGETLAALVRSGAAKLAAEGEPGAILSKIYKQALGRSPTEKEEKVLLASMESDATAQQVEDVLWAVILLPEFQLIY